MKTKQLPIKYQNLLTRNGVDTSKLVYRVMGDKLLTEGIHNKDYVVIINRKNEKEISISVFSFLLKVVLSNETFDYTDKTYLKEIVKKVKKYLAV
jgi:hypothetical protein